MDRSQGCHFLRRGSLNSCSAPAAHAVPAASTCSCGTAQAQSWLQGWGQGDSAAGWREQTVLPGAAGFCLGELRVRAVPVSREFCLVPADLSPVVCGVGAGSGDHKEEEAHRFMSSVPALSATDHNLLYQNSSSSASNWRVFVTPCPAGLKSPSVCGTSLFGGTCTWWQWLRAGQGEDHAPFPSSLSSPQTTPVSSPSP